MCREGLGKVKELQREEDGRDSLGSTADSSVHQKDRTVFCASKHARSRCQSAILMDSGVLADASRGVTWREEWRFAA